MNKKQQFDAVIIGAGQGGIPLATTMSSKGWKTALIERDHVGGTCINTGCTPTKTMVGSARVAYIAKRSEDYGIQTGPVTTDMETVRNRKRNIVNRFRQSTLERIQNSEVTLFRGEASFTDSKTIMVNMNDGSKLELQSEIIIIDTGARPRIPEISGLEQVPYLNSTTIMELDEVPDHLIIVGGGYVGLEFSQMFRRFGSSVTIIQRANQLLTHEDEDVAQAVKDILEDDGIRIMLNSRPTSIKTLDGTIHLMVEGGNAEETHTLTGSHILIAAGRVPNIEILDLESASIKMDESGHIQVDERLQTSVDGVYAIGDVKGGPAFTHISYDDFRILRENLLGVANARTNNRLIPYTVFIDPQLGRVGISEKQANAQGIPYHLAKIPMAYSSRAIEIDQSRGFMKALIGPDSKHILGCAVLGYQGGEIMAILQVAMMAKLPYPTLQEAIFTHPTIAETLNTLFANVEEA